MGKKEIPMPSREQVAEVLEKIEEATQAEKDERRRLGLTQEPEAIFLPRDMRERGGVRPIKKEKGLDLNGYVKRWQEANSGYVSGNIDADRVEIANMTDAEIPFEFVDYLIGKANDSMGSKDIRLLGEIKQIKIRLNRNTKELVVMAKDIKNIMGIFYFEPEPPFGLKKVESHLGIYTF